MSEREARLLDPILPHALDAEGGECFSDCPRCIVNGLLDDAREEAREECAKLAEILPISFTDLAAAIRSMGQR